MLPRYKIGISYFIEMRPLVVEMTHCKDSQLLMNYIEYILYSHTDWAFVSI